MKIKNRFLIFFLYAVVFCFSSCKKNITQKDFVITGELTDYQYGAVYLYDFSLGDEFVKEISSTKIKKGKFTMEGSVPRKGIYFFGTDKYNAVPLIIGGEKINFKASGSNIRFSYETVGSEENKKYKEFTAQMLDYQTKLNNLLQDLNNAAHSSEGNQQAAGLNMKIQDLQNEWKKYIDEARKDTAHFVSIIASLYQNNEPDVSLNESSSDLGKKYFGIYLSHIPFSNLSAAYIPEFRQKLNLAAQTLVFFSPGQEEIRKACDSLLKLSDANPHTKAVILSVFMSNTENNFEELYVYFARKFLELSQEFKETVENKISAAVNSPLKVGSVAPDINLPALDGKLIALSSLRGKYVLLDFWASWCKPCREENPYTLELYKKYHQKGFEIYSVSLDGVPQQQKPKEDWLNAIKKDKIFWSHVSQLKGWQSDVVRSYNISEIPTMFLLDKNGIIVAKKLSAQTLADKLENIF